MGAARAVTGSMHLLQVNGCRVLLECGFFQGKRQESYERNRNLPFDASRIDCCVLSHAHIDHSGNLPNLVRCGFQGNIYATHATRDLCNAMLRDSAHILASDVAYVNKKRQRKGEPPVEVIYSPQEAMASLRQFVSVDYDRWLTIAPGVRLMFRDAGHILGSALCLFEVNEGGRTWRLVYTGDLGRPGLPILRDPVVIPDMDFLITESTYGDRSHGTIEEAKAKLRQVINQTFEKGGKVIIPAFAVGRTQEIVYDLRQLSEARKIPRLPIFVDSPLAVDVTEIFRLHPECYDEETHALVLQSDEHDPLGFKSLRYVRSPAESKDLNYLREPLIIISASGMCESGRILHHLKNSIEDPHNTILIVSFQARHTLGRRLVEGEKQVKIFGEEYERRAAVEVIDGYSAHADRSELLAYIGQLDRQRLKKVFVVHGEPEQAEALARGIRELGVADVQVPAPMETVEIGV